MSFLLERDAINGKDGKAFIIRNRQNIELFHLKQLDANAEVKDNEFVVVGTRIIQKRIDGMMYSGSMTVYYGTPIFLQMLTEYGEGKPLPYFDIQVINNDTSSTVGKQTVVLRNCKLSGNVPIAKLDAQANVLESNVSFSFSQVEVINEFHEPMNYGGQ